VRTCIDPTSLRTVGRAVVLGERGDGPMRWSCVSLYSSAPDFQTYAHDKLRVGLEALIPQLILQSNYVISDAEATASSPSPPDGLVVHYAGDEVMPPDVPGAVKTLLGSGDAVEILAGMMLQNIWTDLRPADNTVVLELAAR